jgi:hypothetical protein
VKYSHHWLEIDECNYSVSGSVVAFAYPLQLARDIFLLISYSRRLR